MLKDHLAVLEAARQRAAQLRARIASSGQATTSAPATPTAAPRPPVTGILKRVLLRGRKPGASNLLHACAMGQERPEKLWLAISFLSCLGDPSGFVRRTKSSDSEPIKTNT